MNSLITWQNLKHSYWRQYIQIILFALKMVAKAGIIILGLSSIRYISYMHANSVARIFSLSAGMTAPQAAGVIHSDFERGFIRAETVMVISTNTIYLHKQCQNYLYL